MYIRLTAIIIKDSSILLIQKKKDDGSFRYTLPGGHWDFPETFKNGVAREVLEECGLKLENSELHKSVFNLKSFRFERYYLCRIHGEDKKKQPNPTVNDLEVTSRHFVPMYVKAEDIKNLVFKNDITKSILEQIINTKTVFS